MHTPPTGPTWPMVSAVTNGHTALGPSLTYQTFTSGAFSPNSNTANYYPILIPSTCVVKRLWWANGSSVSATYNVDCGIYADAGHVPGTKLVSTGSTAQGTASQVQFADVTDTVLAPGLYWIAIVASTTSATMFRAAFGAGYNALAQLEQSSAFPLPSSATPVEATTAAVHLFLCGFATTVSP